MSRSVWWISLRRLKAHELITTLRLFPKEDQSWFNKSRLFTKIQNEATLSFGKLLGQTTLGYLVASSLRSDDNIALTISDFSVSTPAVYFLSLIAFMLLICSISFNHLITSIQVKAELAGQMLLHGFSINAFDVIVHEQENGLGIPNPQSRFFNPIVPVPQVLSFLLLFGVCCLLVPLIAIGIYTGAQLLELASTASVPWYEMAAAYLGTIIAASALFNMILFHIPIPMRRNTMGVRWNFLYRLGPHPSDDEKFRRWLGKS